MLPSINYRFPGNYCLAGWLVLLLSQMQQVYGQPVVLTPEQPQQTYTLLMPARPLKSGIYHLTMTISNRSPHQEFRLVLPRWGVASLQMPGQAVQQAGSLLNLSQRAAPSFQPTFRLTIPSGQTVTCRLRLQGRYNLLTPNYTRATLMPTETFYRQDRQRLIVQGLFMGAVLVMALYNLFIYWLVRDVSYLWFVLSIVGIGLYIGFYYGFGIELFWPDAPRWDLFCFSVIVPATNFVRLAFTRSYLHTAALLPGWDRWLRVLMGVELVVVASGVLAYGLDADWLNVLIPVVGTLGVLIFSLMFIVGLVAYRRNFEPAKYFVLASALLVLGGILFISRELAILPTNFLTRYAVQYGVLVQVIVFSLGLGNRLNRAQVLLTQQQAEQDRQTELNRLKDKLLSVISHDLRSPLASFDSLFRLLSEHYDKLSADEIAKLIARARLNLDQQKSLIDNLLQWAKSQWATQQNNPENVPVAPLIERNVALHQASAEQKQLTITGHVPEPLTVLADRNQIEFVLRNLIQNAVKFSYPGGRVTATAQLIDEQVEICIIDRGSV